MTADAREIRRWLRGIRRSHADRSIWQQFEDAYMWLFAVALFGAMAGNVILNLNARVTGSLYPSTLQPIVVPLALGVALRLLVSFGPIAASPATGFWLLGTPMSRSVLLRPSYLSTIAITALFGPFVALVGWAALGSAWAEVLGGGILMSALLALTACLAVLAQRPRQRYWNSRHARWLADALLVLAAIPAIYEIWHSIEWRRITAGSQTMIFYAYAADDSRRTFSEQLFGYTPTLIGLGLLVALVPLLRFTARRLDRLSRTAVVAGGEAMAGLAGAAASLDLALISDMAVNRHWRQRATVRRSRRGFFVGAPALVMREMVRVLRWPRRFVVGFALLLLPYLSHEIGWRAIVPVVTALAGFAAARPFGDGLRAVGRSAGLTRSLGLSPRMLRLAMAVVPGLFALIWFFLAAPTLGPTPPVDAAAVYPAGMSPADMTPTQLAAWVGPSGVGSGLSSPWAGAPVALALAIGVLAGVIRYAVAPAPKYDGILVSTPMGAVPPGLFSQPLRGVDVVLISLAPVLFNLPTPWLLAIPTAVLTLVIAVIPQRR